MSAMSPRYRDDFDREGEAVAWRAPDGRRFLISSTEHGYALREGSQVEIGGNERYISVSRREFKNVFYGGKRIRLIDPLEAGDGDAPVDQESLGLCDS